MKNKPVPAVNFTTFCKGKTLLEIVYALNFYNKNLVARGPLIDTAFLAEKIPKYFKNWTLDEDDSIYKHGKILTNTHSNGEWITKIFINDNSDYTFCNEDESPTENRGWQYVPETMSEFISDALRYDSCELLLSDKAIGEIYLGNKKP